MNKRILFVQFDSARNGVSTVHTSLAKYFKEEGFYVEFLTYKKENNTDETVKSLGLKSFNIINYLLSFIYADRFLKKCRPDIIISASELNTAPFSFWKRKYGYYLLLNQHTNIEDFLSHSSYFKRVLYRTVSKINKSADIIANVSVAAAEATNRYYSINNCAVLYNPIEPYKEIFSIKEDPIFNGSKVIVACGQVTEGKNYSLMLRAFASAKKILNEANLKLLILGTGPDNILNELKFLAKELNIEDYVIFKGCVPNPRDYMYFSEFLLHTSLYEGLPMVFLEALSAGIPVVTTPFNSSAYEVLGDDKYGLVLEDYQVESVVKGITTMLQIKKDKEFYQQGIKKFLPEECYKAYKKILNI